MPRAANIPNNWGKPWSVEDTAKLQRMFREDRTEKHMAEVLGRSISSVSSKLHYIGLSRPKGGRPTLRLPRAEKLQAKIKELGSISACARYYHCDRKTISYRIGTWKPQNFPSYPWKQGTQT